MLHGRGGGLQRYYYSTIVTSDVKLLHMYLLLDSVNGESLRTIETSIFILCLDKTIPVKFNHRRSIDETEHNHRDDNSVALQMLHGQGSELNSSNRWYDKTMQVNPCRLHSICRVLSQRSSLSSMPFASSINPYPTYVPFTLLLLLSELYKVYDAIAAVIPH